MISASKSKAQQIDFDIDTPQATLGMRARRRQRNYLDGAYEALPDTIEIHGPAVAEIEPIKFNVRVGKQAAPLFVELTQQSLDYRVDVVQR